MMPRFYQLFLCLAAAVLFSAPLAAEQQSIRLHRKKAGGGVSLLTVPGRRQANAASGSSAAPAENARIFLGRYASLLGVGDPDGSLRLLNEKRDELGQIHLRYAQQKNGVPVFGASLHVHIGPDAQVRAAGGQGLDLSRVSTWPVLSAADAIVRGEAVWRQRYSRRAQRRSQPALFFFNKRLLQGRPGGETRLAWRVFLSNARGSRAQLYLIDAISGELLYEAEGVRRDISRRIYDCGATDGDCHLDHMVSIWGQWVTLGRSEGAPERATHPQYSEAQNETNLAYDYLGYAHRYYFDTFGRNGANDAGGIGDGWVIYSGETRAYTYVDDWRDRDFECPNAMFMYSVPSMQFCRGLVALDIVAHEYSHAMSYYTIVDGYGQPSGFIYSDQSGALEEGFADIFAAAIEHYARGAAANWEMGEDSSMGTLRSMSDPPSYNSGLGYMPDRWHSPLVYCGTSDRGGVHHNAGVIGKLAYLIAEGGSFNGCSITGLGRAKEEQILYRAMRFYLSPNADFNDVYEAVLVACSDLYGESDCRQVRKALLAVELDQPGRCSSVPRVDPAAFCAHVDDPTLPTPTPIDMHPPSIVIAAPRNGARVRSGQVIRFSDSELTAPFCSLNGKSWYLCQSDVTRMRDIPEWRRIRPNRAFRLYIKDTDASGNTGLAVVRRLRLSPAAVRKRLRARRR